MGHLSISDGGAWMAVNHGEPSVPVAVDCRKVKGGKVTSSYEEGKEALKAAVNRRKGHAIKESDKIMICTDSKSLTTVLKNDSKDIIRIGRQHYFLKRHIETLGHMEIPRNEIADRLANDAKTLKSDHRPITFKSATSVIKRSITDNNPDLNCAHYSKNFI